MKKKATIKFVFAIGLLFPLLFAQNYNKYVKNLINEVKTDTLKKYVSNLSGETPVIIDGVSYIIKSRYTKARGNNLAATYIYNTLKKFGLRTENHQYSAEGRNVIATQPGIKDTSKIYIVCGHYDSISSSEKAPGADDNASGTAGVMEIARILSKKKLDYTVKYAFWDEEEIGLIGSNAYTKMVKDEQVKILGVLNLDMISYDSNNDSRTLIVSDQKSNWIIPQIKKVNKNYNLGLIFDIDSTGNLTASDHSAFWNQGYPAVLLIEPLSDLNKFYHTSNDLLKNINLPYFTKMVKLSAGIIAHWAGGDCITGIKENNHIVNSYKLNQNYPNPFNPGTNISFSIAEYGYVTLKIYNMLGQKVKTLIGDNFEPGEYTVRFNADNNLPNGVYIYRISTQNWSSSKKMLFIK